MRPGTPTDRPGGQTGDGRGRRWARSRWGRAAPAATRRPGRAWRGAAARRGASSPRRGFAAGPQFGPETAIKLPRAFGARSGDRWTLRGTRAGSTPPVGRWRSPSHGLGGRRGAAPPNSRCVAMNWRITVRELCGDKGGHGPCWAATLPSCAVICSAVTGCSGSVSRDTQDFESVGRRFDPCRAYHLKP